MIKLKVKCKPFDEYKCIKLPLKKLLYKTPQNSEFIYKDKNSDVEKRVRIGDLSNEQIVHDINDAVIRTNLIVTKAYFLLREWLLLTYRNGLEIPHIDTDIIETTFQVIYNTRDKKRSSKIRKDETMEEEENRSLKDHVYDELQQLNPFKRENGKNLSGVLQLESMTMLTAIENNIRCHFVEYLNRFVNILLKNQYVDAATNKELMKQLNQDMFAVKSDLLFRRQPAEYKSDPKYHPFIHQYCDLILPKLEDNETFEQCLLHQTQENVPSGKEKNNVHYDVRINPQKYLKHMIYMNLTIEEYQKRQELNGVQHKGSMFQFCPMRTKVTPEHISIDTKSLVEILISHGNTFLYKNTHPLGDKIWRTFFNVDRIKYKNYSFDRAIMTNGVSVSVRLIHPLRKEKKEQEYINKEKGLERRQRGEPKLEKKKTVKLSGPVIKPSEFLYMTEVPKKLLEGDVILSDPGKNKPMTSVHAKTDKINKGDENDEIFKYTNKQRIHETKRLVYQKELERRREKQGITAIEAELCNYNSKTCDPDLFLLYMIKKVEINDRLMLLYSDPKYRNYQWYGYLNRVRSDNLLIEKVNDFFDSPDERKEKQAKRTLAKVKKREKNRRKIRKRRTRKRRTEKKKKKLMEQIALQKPSAMLIPVAAQAPSQHEHQPMTSSMITEQQEQRENTAKMNAQMKSRIIIMGDWSITKQMRNFISTPNIRIKRLLARHFTLYEIDEFRTSILYYKTGEKCDNLYLPDSEGKFRKIHSVLTYHMENQRLGCINRDRNACYNMRKLFRYYMETGGRPDRYSRGYDL